MNSTLFLRRLILYFIVFTGVVYSQVTLTLPSVSGVPGTNIQNAAVLISDVTGKNIDNFQFQINYNASIIAIYGISTSGTLSSNFGPYAAADTINGTLRIAGAAASPMVGSGTLLYLKIRIKAQSGSSNITYAATGLYPNGGQFTSIFGSTSNTVTPVNGTALVGSSTPLTLTVLSTNGTVTKNPDQAAYNFGTTVTLTATPNAGYTFSGWSGDVTGTTNQLTVTMSSNKNIIANYTINTYTLSVSAANGTVAKSPDQINYNYGSSVILTATPIAGYTFSSWSGDASGSTNPLSVLMNGNKNITANFVANNPPTLNFNPAGPTFNVAEGSNLSVQLVGSDPDVGDVLSYAFTSTPTITGASLTTSTGVFSWTPITNQAGTYNVIFSVTDGKGTTTKNATIIVAKTNLAPALTLNPVGPFSVLEGNNLSITLNGTDPNSGDVLTYSFTSAPTMTGATLNASTKVFSWPTIVGQAGSYNVTFSVSDGQLTTNVSTTITVTSINSAPTLTLDPQGPYLVYETNTLKITLVGTDPNSGDVLTYSVTAPSTLPAGSQLVNNVFTWTPDYGMASLTPYNFTFKVKDPSGLSASVSIIIIVGKSNRPPVFTTVLPSGLVCQVNKPAPTIFVFTYKATDPENDNLTFTLISGPVGASITTDGVFKWGPTVDQLGQSYVVTVQVSDGSLSVQTSQIIYASSTITAIEDYSGLPSEYRLMQNYPNPFNPTTTINYSLPKEGFVKLVIYDLLGKEVATLVNRNLNAGYHSVSFDASKLQSGLYLYRIQANDYVSIKKMLLMK